MDIEQKETEERLNNLAVSHDVTTRKGFGKELAERIKIMDVTGLGAQLAFFFLLSIFPLLLFLITLLPYLNLSKDQVYDFLVQVMPGEIYLLIEETLNEILTTQNTGLLSFGIIATIWSASLGMDALIKSLNFSYGVEENRPLIVSRGMSIVLTILMIFILIVALALPIFGRQIGLFIFTYLGQEEGFLELWGAIRFIIPSLIIFLVCTVIYWVAPNIRLDLKSVLTGAIFTTIGWLIISYGFSIYINNFGNFSATYGSIGGIIVLMLWLYLSAMLLLIGGQVNAVMQGRRDILVTRKKNRAS
ncbi:YihY/virulence factor BrkB family protein [Planococcus sp. FY231025]|uniref:YihY/virulence factor BrkB family protein n=1 Tax=Planococcus sp. FY231025 TaxID=3455699 RepID=UPI003F9215A6